MNRKLLPVGILLVLLFTSLVKDKPYLNVIFIGDSITHGTGSKDQSSTIFAGEYLKAKNRFGSVQISNQGVSGYTTVDFLPATNKAYRKVQAAAAPLYANEQAELVFSIMLGTNDSAIKGPTGSPVSVSNYHDNLKIITDSLLAAYPRCKVILNYPIWYSNNTHNRGATYMQEGLTRVQSYCPQIKMLVNEYKKRNPHHVFLGDTKGMKYFEKNYLTLLKPEKGLDGTFYLHPNREGDAALGTLWAKAVLKALK